MIIMVFCVNIDKDKDKDILSLNMLAASTYTRN